MSERNSWCDSFSPNDLPEATMLGYSKQIKAGTSIALSVIKGTFKSMLIFGFPGNGKTLFPKALAQRLKDEESQPFSLVMISCGRMPTELGDPTEILSGLDETVQSGLQSQPVIMCFDEVDLLCPHISEVLPGRGAMSAWMRRLLKDEKSPLRATDTQAVLVGVTNYPSCIESSVKRNFEIPLYFEPTPICVAKRIIKEFLTNDEQVAQKYTENFQNLRLRPMGAEIIRACNQVKKIYPELGNISSDEIVRSMKANTPIPPSERELQSYVKSNKDLIDMSRKYAIPNWLDVYERTKKRRKL